MSQVQINCSRGALGPANQTSGGAAKKATCQMTSDIGPAFRRDLLGT